MWPPVRYHRPIIRTSASAVCVGLSPRARSFALAFLLAFVVTAVPLTLFSARLYVAGELAPGWQQLVARLDLHYGRLIDDHLEFKRFMLAARRPRTTVIGSSRVMEMTSTIFTKCAGDPSCFYNGGGLMPSLRTGLDALKLVPAESFPRVLIIGFDYWMVASFPPNDHGPTMFATDDPLDRLKAQIAAVRTVAEQARSDPDLLAGILRPWQDRPGVGLRARLHGTGFRGDGSHDYGPGAAELLSDPHRSDEIMNMARTATGWFSGGARIDDRSIDELRQILRLATERGAFVIGYTPPFADDVAAAAAASGHHPAWAQMPGVLSAVFAEYSFPFFATMTQSQATCDPAESLDGFHPTEPCDARIVALMERDDAARRALAPFVDADALARLIASRASPLALTTGTP